MTVYTEKGVRVYWEVRVLDAWGFILSCITVGSIKVRYVC